MKRAAQIILILGVVVLGAALGVRIAASSGPGNALDVAPGEGRLEQVNDAYVALNRSWALGGIETATPAQEEAIIRLGVGRSSRIIGLELRRRELEKLVEAAQANLTRALTVVPVAPTDQEVIDASEEQSDEWEGSGGYAEKTPPPEGASFPPEEAAAPEDGDGAEELPSEVEEPDGDVYEAVGNLAKLEEEYRNIVEELSGDELESERERLAEIALLAGGAERGAQVLLARWGQPFRRVGPGPGLAGLASQCPVLVVPSGAMEKKTGRYLASYVKAGGTVISFAQRSGDELAALPGRPRGFGWAEAESALIDSVDVAAAHPATAACRKSRFSAAVDGFFTELPNGAEVLLRDVRSGQPVAVTYRVGKGRVFATTLFTDWTAVSRVPSDSEYRFLRDAVLWSLADGRRLHPEAARPGQIVKVAFPVSNRTKELARKIRVGYLTPEGAMSGSFELNMTLLPGDKGEAKAQVRAPKTPGIWHLVYALIRPDGTILQTWQNAVDIASVDSAPSSPAGLGAALTTQGELVRGKVTAVLHLFNRTASEIEVVCHGPVGQEKARIAAGETETVSFHLPEMNPGVKGYYEFRVSGYGETIRLYRLITAAESPRKEGSK